MIRKKRSPELWRYWVSWVKENCYPVWDTQGRPQWEADVWADIRRKCGLDTAHQGREQSGQRTLQVQRPWGKRGFLCFRKRKEDSVSKVEWVKVRGWDMRSERCMWLLSTSLWILKSKKQASVLLIRPSLHLSFIWYNYVYWLRN